jgi:hypothetical protein
MTTLPEKQTIPASDNRTPNNIFFIPQVLHFRNQYLVAGKPWRRDATTLVQD